MYETLQNDIYTTFRAALDCSSIKFKSLEIRIDASFTLPLQLTPIETDGLHTLVVSFSIKKKMKRYAGICRIALEKAGDEKITRSILLLLLKKISKRPVDTEGLSPDALCRQAGSAVMEAYLGWTTHATHQLCLHLNKLSLARYESHAPLGSIIIEGRKKLPVPDIELVEKVSLAHTRAVRKLLEVGENGYCLYASEAGIIGLTELRKQVSKSYLRIDFSSDHSWTLVIGNEPIFEVFAGLPVSYSQALSRSTFQQTFTKVFSGYSSTAIETLYRLIDACRNITSGTNILIHENASEVAKRLHTQCTMIKPVSVTPSMLQHIASIDGTVILDADGICYGFGAILDGAVAVKGDRSRGGRFNSAVMFCENSKHACMIIVISQDRTIDIITSARE